MTAAPVVHPLLFTVLGMLVFLNVSAPQSLLPLLARGFHAGAAQVGGVIGAAMLSVALARFLPPETQFRPQRDPRSVRHTQGEREERKGWLAQRRSRESG